MANTTKGLSDADANQVDRYAFNDQLKTIGVDGFLSAKIGHRIELTISQTTIADDTETYEYFDNGVSLLQIEIVYTDGNRTVMLSSERIA